MLTPTHLVAAHTTYLGVCIATARPPDPVEALVALGGALLPDIDSWHSYTGRIVLPISRAIGNRWGHRTITHALLTQFAVGMLAWWLLPSGYATALLAGWISHSIADAMTPSGVCWFWPSRVRCVLPGNPRYRMETGGGGELGFLLVVALLGLVLMPLASSGKGTSGLVRGALGNLESARLQYDRDKGSTAFRVKMQGRDNRTYADVSGTYEVIGPWTAAGLILDTADGPRSLCTGPACDWYADHAELLRAEPQVTTSRPLKVELVSAAEVAAALAPVREREVYLLGTLLLDGVKAQPPTLEVSGEAVTLVYARPDLLDEWAQQGRALRALDLTVQIRHAAGEAIPPLLLEEGTAPLVPPLLQRWLQPAN